jgi:hypothetical protein
MRYRRRGIHYLGNLQAKLADLQGYATLAHELVQNADDVHDAAWLRFDVREDALVVDNGGLFTSCDQLDLDDCPWLETETLGRRCDFHRFTWIGSGDKRQEEGTTGAFGIGFLSVYQVTDSPQLISNGQHWLVDETQDESKRIAICDGCEACRGSNLPGTRFILPWAADSGSRLRNELRAQAFTTANHHELVAKLSEILPGAMLFLRNLGSIELQVGGQPALKLERIVDGSDLIVSDGQHDRVWRRLPGSFESGAKSLRGRHPGKIEPKRRSDVTLAFGDDESDSGLLFAWLPTQDLSGLPFHIHADFFPTNDRKHLLWEADYRSDWNREAIRAAARAVREHLVAIRDTLGPRRFWQMVKSAHDLKEAPNEAYRCFWSELLPAIQRIPCVFTSRSAEAGGKREHGLSGEWSVPSETVFVDSAYREYLRTIEALDLKSVHPDLTPFRTLLVEQQNGVSVPIFRLPAVNRSLAVMGLTTRTVLDEAAPTVVRNDTAREKLWGLLNSVLENPQAGHKEDRAALAGRAVVMASDGALWPCNEVYQADEHTAKLFATVGAGVPFLILPKEHYEHLRALSPDLTAATALDFIERACASPEGLSGGVAAAVSLLRWFASRREEFRESPALHQRLAALPLFPSAETTCRLVDLSLPGDFDDPLHLANLVDVSQAVGLIDFLHQLGARPLSLREYVTKHLARALNDPLLPADKRRATLVLLVQKLGELSDDATCHRALRQVNIVECSDGSFVMAGEAYFPSQGLELLPAAKLKIAVLLESHEGATRQLYEWLGVAAGPRYRDIADVIQAVTSEPPSDASLKMICAAVEHLGQRLRDADAFPVELEPLRMRRWLPAEGAATWYAPKDVWASYSREVFWSQAEFLDVPRGIQGECRGFIDQLGIPHAPSTQQIVRHLLHCAGRDIAVDDQVYRWLSDRADDRSLDALRDRPCIHVAGQGFVSPEKVFWGPHGFGTYRFTLGEKLLGYAKFLNRVGVRQSPTAHDAKMVLEEIGADSAHRGRSLDDDTAAVVRRCWYMLAEALELGELSAETLRAMHSLPVVPDGDGLLNRPDLLFFEDRAGLASRFRHSLGPNVIPLAQVTARAMEEAGVRRLSRHTSAEVLHCDDRRENVWLKDWVHERRPQLRRVLHTVLGDTDPNLLDQLDEISFESTSRLMIRYVLTALDRPLPPSEPESPRAHYHKDEGTLLVEFRDGKPSWAAVARELGGVLCSEVEPGRIAPAFIQVLQADSPAASDDSLDQLGFPPTEISQSSQAPTSAVIDQIGTTGSGGEQPERAGPLEDTKPTTPSSTQPTTNTRPSGKSKPQERRGRFVTYVVPPEQAPTQQTTAVSDHRTAVEKAGIMCVIRHEAEAGRRVKEMPPNHPGYDLESYDSDDQLVRYIEVKSTAGDWKADGVGLTKAEFEHAQEFGEDYWLYVVERADSPDHVLHRIQNPGRLANQFFYDHGWRQLAELG